MLNLLRKVGIGLVIYVVYSIPIISLYLPFTALEEGKSILNHVFLLMWAVVAMVAAVFRSRQETKCSRKILGDAIVAGVVVYSGLALFLVVFGDYYRELLELRGSLLRISQWKVFVFVLEGFVLASGSIVVIWRTNGWSMDETDASNDSGAKGCSQEIHECCCRTVGGHP